MAGAAIFLFSQGSSERKDPKNPPVANTGAPGETTCQQSNCHSGGSFTGTVTLTGLPDTVLADSTYDLTITETSNAVNAGFQTTCLDGANKFMGTFTAGTGVNIGSQPSSGRKYARQSNQKSLSGGSVSWTWKWKAPAALTAGDSIKFYSSMLAANGNGGNSGDNVLSHAHKVYFKAKTTANENVIDSQEVFTTQSTSGGVQVHILRSIPAQVQVINGGGVTLHQRTTTGAEQLTIEGLIPGIYLVAVTQEGKTYARKVFVSGR